MLWHDIAGTVQTKERPIETEYVPTVIKINQASLAVWRQGRLMEQGTFFAPGPRDPLSVVEDEAILFSGSHIGQHILDAIPDLAVILNDKRQIVAANEHCLLALGAESEQSLMGRRIGEAVRCIHAFQGPSGCGTSEHCRQCGATKAIQTCLNAQHSVQYECRLTTQGPEGDSSKEFLAKANYVKIGDHPLVLLVLRDISAEKRKEALERLFFHDVLNTVGGMIGLTDLMVAGKAQDSVEYARLIHHLAESVAEEITAHRNLIQAEAGTLQLDTSNVYVSDLFQEITESLSPHPVCKDRTIESHVQPECSLRTDRLLLRRIVGNMVKNALEASPIGSTTTLSAEQTKTGVSISVNNPGVMPAHVLNQLFKRSFSTKGETGRGLGTYSIKLFTERYLGGSIEVDSNSNTGTTFTVILPSLGPNI